MKLYEGKSGKIVYFDGLRGFAALIVVFHHFKNAFYPALYTGREVHVDSRLMDFINNTPVRLFLSGDVAVCTFFCLSGFVLSNGYFRKQDRLAVVNSAFRRYFRLTIPILTASIFSYALLSLDLMQNQVSSRYTGASSFGAFLHINPSFINMFTEAVWGVYVKSSKLYNPVLWTMRPELIGSFLVYSFLLLLGKYRVRYIFYAAFLYLFTVVNVYFTGFFLGMLLSDLSARGRLEGIVDKAAVTMVLLVSGILLGGYQPVTDLLVGNAAVIKLSSKAVGAVIPMAGAFCFLLALLCSGTMKRVFSSRPMHFLGQISFSLYLTHFILQLSLTSSLFNWLYGSVRLSYNESALTALALSLPVMLSISYLMYLAVDLQSIRFGKYLWKKVSGMTGHLSAGFVKSLLLKRAGM